MIKSFKIIISLLLIQLLVVSSSFGEEKNVKDCFEKINRATFAFNMALDKVLFRPVATGYRKLPSPIRTGTSNVLSNLSNLQISDENGVFNIDVNVDEIEIESEDSHGGGKTLKIKVLNTEEEE